MSLVRPPLSSPGVYVQEVPAGTQMIVGVPTSVTVFVGRTRWGPVEEPTRIGSVEGFRAVFGDALPDGHLAACVEDFFQNGGVEALVVRLFAGCSAGATGAALAADRISGGPAGFTAPPLVAAYPGALGAGISVVFDTQGITDAVRAEVAAATPGWDGGDLVNLTITLDPGSGPVVTERFTNVSPSGDAGPRALARVLEQGSRLLRVGGAAGDAAPASADSAPLTDTEYDGAITALRTVDLFNLVCLPPDALEADGTLTAVSITANGKFAGLCRARRALLVVDPPRSWEDATTLAALDAARITAGLGVGDDVSDAAAAYFPWLLGPGPEGSDAPAARPPSGAVAGIMAYTDAARGVWKAPAGMDAGVAGILGLSYTLTNDAGGALNALGINGLRTFSAAGPVVWGARTLRGRPELADDYRYVPVRRLADYIEASLLRGTQWAVFEPNAEPLWASVQLAVGTFMASLFAQGAFAGSSTKDAFFVTCDASVNPPADQAAGVLNVVVGFAPVKPAEFLVLYLQQSTLPAG